MFKDIKDIQINSLICNYFSKFLTTYNIDKINAQENNILVHLSTIKKPVVCVNCLSKKIRKHKKKNQFYFDIPITKKRTGLQIEIQGYYCNNCNKTFQESLTYISKSHRMTERLVKYIEKKSLKIPFTHIAKQVGCSEGTVRKIFKNYVYFKNKVKKRKMRR